MLVPEVDVAFHALPRRRSGYKVEHFSSVGTKTHVIIELVVRLDGRTDPARDCMVWQGRQIRYPVRIYRPTRLKSAPNPRAIVFLALRRIRMHRVVHKHDADSLFCQRIHLLPTLPDDTGSVCIDHHGFGTVENRVITGPAFDDICFDVQTALFIERLRQNLASGVKFMFTGAVAPSSSKEDDTRFSDCACSEAEQEKE